MKILVAYTGVASSIPGRDDPETADVLFLLYQRLPPRADMCGINPFGQEMSAKWQVGENRHSQASAMRGEAAVKSCAYVMWRRWVGWCGAQRVRFWQILRISGFDSSDPDPGP